MRFAFDNLCVLTFVGADAATKDPKQTLGGRECDVKKAQPQPVAQQQKRMNVSLNVELLTVQGNLDLCQCSKVKAAEWVTDADHRDTGTATIKVATVEEMAVMVAAVAAMARTIRAISKTTKAGVPVMVKIMIITISTTSRRNISSTGISITLSLATALRRLARVTLLAIGAEQRLETSARAPVVRSRRRPALDARRALAIIRTAVAAHSPDRINHDCNRNNTSSYN